MSLLDAVVKTAGLSKASEDFALESEGGDNFRTRNVVEDGTIMLVLIAASPKRVGNVAFRR